MAYTEIVTSSCEVIADLYQLAGEIYFDANQYTEAAHCYTLAAIAGQEARTHDLWACALTRHAFIALYEQQFARALPMLDLAATVAGRGDSTLSTRHWVAAVQAETLAGLGDQDGCARALDTAGQVRGMNGEVHNGGWLRFDGTRLAEQQGTCYVSLGRLDLAESILADALSQPLSTRRRASVLVDLVLVGAHVGDPQRVVARVDAALAAAQTTGSAMIGSKLRNLKTQLFPLLSNEQVCRLDVEITALAGQAVTG